MPGAGGKKRKFAQPEAEQDPPVDHFARLPDELIVHILEMVPNPSVLAILRVCKRWNALVVERCSWKDLCLKNVTLSWGDLDCILAWTKVLEISNCKISGPMPPVRHSRLQSLAIRHCSTISTNGFRHLARCCPALKRLALEDTAGMLNGVMFAYIGELEHLEELEIKDRTIHYPLDCKCSRGGIVTMLRGCQRLKSFGLEFYLTYYSDMIKAITDNLAPSVEKLYIDKQPNCEHLVTLAGRCPNIYDLQVFGLPTAHILQMKKLTHLTVGGYNSEDIEALSQLGGHAALKKITFKRPWYWLHRNYDPPARNLDRLARALPGVEIVTEIE